jgi:hypothetical protein
MALVITAANVNDLSVLAELLDGRVLPVPEAVLSTGQHLCVDGAYDYTKGHAVAQERAFTVHVQPKPGSIQAQVPEGAERHPARRWVVEVVHAWLNRWLRVQIRWEKKLSHYAGFVQLATCLLIWRKILLKARALSG